MLVLAAMLLLSLAALLAGSAPLFWLVLLAGAVWGVARIAALLDEDARRLRDWWRRGP